MAGTPDPRPEKRKRADDWTLILAEKVANRVCRGCGSGRQGMHAHHIVPRSQGGDDVAANIVPLCAHCHERWHRGDKLVARRIGQTLTADELNYVFTKKGYDWRKSRYPLSGEAPAAAGGFTGERASGGNAALPDSAGGGETGASSADVESDPSRIPSVTTASPQQDREPCPSCGGTGQKKHRHKTEKPRPKRTYSIAVPVDEAENGLELLKTLVEECAKERGRDDQPAYYTLVEVCHFYLTTPKEEA